MRRPWTLVLCLGGCMELPPAIDPEAAAPSAPAPATVSPPAKVEPVASAPPRQPASNCPVATGRAQFCEGRRVCSRDENGCETCRCNTELDSGRAGFEQMNPWDMRQR